MTFPSFSNIRFPFRKLFFPLQSYLVSRKPLLSANLLNANPAAAIKDVRMH